MQEPSGNERRPLTGVRVLDLTRLYPGAYCTHLLRQQGAEVIKVERPDGGDHLRWAPPLRDGQSVLFDALNHGKQSLTLDLKAHAGRDIFMRLAATAQVVVEGNRPGVLDRLGVGWSALHEANPRLVLCSITGYGQTGAHRTRAGHDLNYMALAGALSLNGPAGHAPVPYGLQVADFAGGGMGAAFAITAALVAAAQGAEGAHLDVSMTDGVRGWLAPQLAQVAIEGTPPDRGRQPLSGAYPCYRVYECADGRYFSVAALEPRFWEALCAAVGEPGLVGRQLDTGSDAHAELERVFRTRSRDEWQAVLAGLDTCCEPVLELHEVEPWQPVRGPALGEHTGQVLRALGCEDSQVADLRAQRVV